MTNPQRHAAIVAHVSKKIAATSQSLPSRHLDIVSHVTRKIAMSMPATETMVGAGAGALLGGAAGAYLAPIDQRTGKKSRGRQVGQAILGAIAGGAAGGGIGYGVNRYAGAGERAQMDRAVAQHQMSQAQLSDTGPAIFAEAEAAERAKPVLKRTLDNLSKFLKDPRSGGARRDDYKDYVNSFR